MTGAFDALRDGVGRVNRAPVLVFGVWLALLAAALPATLLMREAIADHLGASLAADAAADGVNYDWMVEFNQRAAGAAGPLTPNVIGFAAVLDNFSAFLDREPRALVVSLAGAASLVVWLLLMGGVLDRLARGRPTGVHGFFSATGVFFFRFLRLGALAAIAYGLLITWLHPWLESTYGGLAGDLTVERTAFLLRLGLYAAFAAAFAAVNLLFDYAKVRAIVEDRRSMIGALVSATRFVRRNARSAIALYALNLALAGGVVGAYALVAPGAGPRSLSTWPAFAVGQAYILGRLWVKLVSWASGIALFQQRLAHAGYVSRARPVWPDAPVIEGVRH